MDNKIKELIAIGASVATHCQPCLTFHAAAAKKEGATTEEIGKAIEIGAFVLKASTKNMEEFSATVLEGPDDNQCEGGQCKLM